MERFRILFGMVALAQFAHSETVTWTTLAGDSVEASIVGFYGQFIFLEEGKKRARVNVPYAALDEKSKILAVQWLRNHVAESEAVGPVEQSDSPLSKYLAYNLVTYDNGKLVPFDFASRADPEFYAFYFSARWCGPCRKFTPRLVAFYEAMKLIGHDNFELIFVSSDSGTGEMKKYMHEDEMPWPAIKFGKKSNKLISRMKGSGIPCLVVTDRYGRILAHSYRGSEYLGPEKPKEALRSFLSYSEKFRMDGFLPNVGN